MSSNRKNLHQRYTLYTSMTACTVVIIVLAPYSHSAGDAGLSTFRILQSFSQPSPTPQPHIIVVAQGEGGDQSQREIGSFTTTAGWTVKWVYDCTRVKDNPYFGLVDNNLNRVLVYENAYPSPTNWGTVVGQGPATNKTLDVRTNGCRWGVAVYAGQ